MKVLLYSREGKKKQEVVLNPEIYGVRANDRLLELVRNAYSGNLRKGTVDTKTRGEVRGGGKKPWKQKGREGRAPARVALRFGWAAGRCLVRIRGITPCHCPKRSVIWR